MQPDSNPSPSPAIDGAAVVGDTNPPTSPASPSPAIAAETYQTIASNHPSRWDTSRDYRQGWKRAERFAISSDGPRDRATADVLADEARRRANVATDDAARMHALGEAARYYTLARH